MPPARVLRAAHGVLQTTSVGLDRVVPPAQGVTFLIYHRVGGRSGTSVDLPVEQFREQLGWLAEDFDVLGIDEAAERLAGDAGRPGVVITFDDGTVDWSEAMEVLVEVGLPATFYVATRFVDEGIPFDHDGTPISWAGLADMASTGLATIGSHTHTHRLLHRTDSAETADELDRSIALIEHHVGGRCEHFAYPKAIPPEAAAEVEVRARFTTAALARSGANPVGRTDLLRLRRVPIQRSDDRVSFLRKASGGMRLEGAARDAAARWRFRSATN
jgi:peptidoglycan/xylan/chitin deacetylase (PgdA/CDA1 family)